MIVEIFRLTVVALIVILALAGAITWMLELLRPPTRLPPPSKESLR